MYGCKYEYVSSTFEIIHSFSEIIPGNTHKLKVVPRHSTSGKPSTFPNQTVESATPPSTCDGRKAGRAARAQRANNNREVAVFLLALPPDIRT